jgi:NAD(P)H-dependent nitrite reductase small subunit
MEDELSGFTKICKAEVLKENTGSLFFVNDNEVAVFKVNGEVYALSNICPHLHSSIIYDGFIEEGYILCPAHGWEFNIKTGSRKCGGKGVDSYPVKVIDDDVYVKVKKKKYFW